MKKSTRVKSLIAAMSLLIMMNFVSAQTKVPPSPAATASGVLKNGATIKIAYSSPAVKGRKIWGDLVPFDKVWRAGANDATQFETDKDILVDGHQLQAGKYSIYAIPREMKRWLIIFSSQTGQPGMNHDGSSTLDSSKIVFRAAAKVKKSASMNERLVYTINKKGFVLSWENVDVHLSMK